MSALPDNTPPAHPVKAHYATWFQMCRGKGTAENAEWLLSLGYDPFVAFDGHYEALTMAHVCHNAAIAEVVMAHARDRRSRDPVPDDKLAHCAMMAVTASLGHPDADEIREWLRGKTVMDTGLGMRVTAITASLERAMTLAAIGGNARVLNALALDCGTIPTAVDVDIAERRYTSDYAPEAARLMSRVAAIHYARVPYLTGQFTDADRLACTRATAAAMDARSDAAAAGNTASSPPNELP